MKNFSKNTIKRFRKLEKSGQILNIHIQSTNGGLVSDAFKHLESLQKIVDLKIPFTIFLDSSGGYVTSNSAVLMPCGSNHSCYHCNGYYFGCTWLSRMSEDEYEKHEQLVNATR